MAAGISGKNTKATLAMLMGVAAASGMITAGEHGWLASSAIAQTQGGPVGSTEIADMVDKVKPAVVGVRTRVTLPQEDQQVLSDTWEKLFGAPKERGGSRDRPDAPLRPRVSTSQGSGFFISSDGYIVTTNHVVDGGQTIEITTDDDKTYTARVVGSDDRTDLALLKVDAERDFPFVPLATRTPRIGEWVITVGNPFGLGGTVTAGIVSARARDIKIGTFNDFIQIDAPVNQGNSGGPTFDLRGNVIGVNSAIFSPSGGSVGIGFAIPAETVSDVAAKLKERGSIVRGWLGVQIQPLTPELAQGLGIKETRGAVVVEPQPNGPAAGAGVVAADVITAVNGEPVKDDRELTKRIGDLPPGASVNLDIARKEDRKTIVVTLAEMPRGRGAPSPSPAQRPRPDPMNFGFELTPSGKLGDEQGVIVTDVNPDGAAADRGLRTGDMILEIDGKKMRTAADVHKVLVDARAAGKQIAIARVKSGDGVRLVAIRLG